MSANRAEPSYERRDALWIIQFAVFAAVVLYFARSILIPISFALLLSFVLYPLCRWLELRRISRLTSIIIALSTTLLTLLLLVAVLVYQFLQFMQEWPTLLVKLNQSWTSFSIFLEQYVGLTAQEQKKLLDHLSSESGSNILAFLRGAVTASAYSLVMLILVPVYVVLILYYRSYWLRLLQHLLPGENRKSLHAMITGTVQTYYSFIKGMVLIYFLVGILNSLGLLLLGIPHAILFGFIASILTFIPYVGIMVGSLLPITVAWVTYDSIWYPVGVIGVFTFVQYLEANVIFPFAVSSRLNVNTFAMLIAIFTGGLLWGVSGMILFVPFTAIAKLVADHNPKWKTLSLILGTETTLRKEKA